LNTLFLLHGNRDLNQIDELIYADIILYLHENVTSGYRYAFENDHLLVQFIQKNKICIVVSDRRIAHETALLLRGLQIVIITIGTAEGHIQEFVDITIDPLSSPQIHAFTGLRYLLSKTLAKVSLNDLSKLLKISSDVIQKEVAANNAEANLISIVSLFTKLDWDSQFFEINVGFASCYRLTPSIQRLARQFIQKENIKLFEYLCGCHDKLSVETAEHAGYSFVDIRLAFERNLDDVISPGPRDGFDIRRGAVSDIPRLKEIASELYKDSRYYFDGNFDFNKVTQFYSDWIEKAILGTFDDYAYVLYEKDKPIGFCTIKEYKARSAKISLFGLDKEVQGRGLGLYLLENVLYLLQQDGKIYVRVITQGRNYIAQRLYQRAGFLTQKTELWYHKWLY